MRISAGITSYNQRDYLIEAIESVLAQSLPPAEILIVDDASGDDSPQVIAGYAARYPDVVRPILLARNGGVNAARNHILDAASGDYLAFLDGDDRWRPGKLEREARRLSEPDGPQAAFSNFLFTRGDGGASFLWATGRRPPEGDILPHVLTLDMPRQTLFRSELAPTALWRQAGHYDPAFTVYGDWDMRVRLAAAVRRFAYVDEPLSEYRRHGAGLSNKPVELHLAAVDQIERKYAGLIAQLSATHGYQDDYFRRGFARWRAKLLRWAALDLTVRRPPGFRVAALRRYRESLAYHRTLDGRLLWRMVRP
ncbi:glycosyltransferase family 2 protein [Promineifilum sp.]|uniref:glycosyltransferase family 2 protein n=1 Tax=Promineifilum sp. TaxID=2664178 RepID=UPI0035B30694